MITADYLERKTFVTQAGCWEWTGVPDEWGYGVAWDGTTNRKAHRVAWEFAVGPIPRGLLVLHKCDNPPCCNPDHLFLGTQKDNVRDCMMKGRRGINPRAKLTRDDAFVIRSAYRTGLFSERTLARFYKVGKSSVRSILKNRAYKVKQEERGTVNDE